MSVISVIGFPLYLLRRWPSSINFWAKPLFPLRCGLTGWFGGAPGIAPVRATPSRIRHSAVANSILFQNKPAKRDGTASSRRPAQFRELAAILRAGGLSHAPAVAGARTFIRSGDPGVANRLYELAARNLYTYYKADWPAPGSEDTELGVFMGPEVSHGETKIYAGVQA